MGMVLKTLLGALAGGAFLSSSSTAARPRRKVSPVVRPKKSAANLVKRKFLTHWQQRRWSKNGNTYTGYYRTPFGAYRGQIDYRHKGQIDFWIFNPPDCLKNHSHARCFISKGKGVYYVHFSEPSLSVDDGIRAIEKILLEAHRKDAANK